MEVSDTSVGRGRLVKIPIYARQKVSEVWIVDIQGDRVIVHTQPSGGDYGLIRTAHRGETLRPAPAVRRNHRRRDPRRAHLTSHAAVPAVRSGFRGRHTNRTGR